LSFALKPALCVLALVTLPWLSACSFREDPNAEKKADPVPVREAVNKHTISKRDFRIEFLPQERPNDYLIRLHWPAGKDVALNITRVRPLDGAGRPEGIAESEVVSAASGGSKDVGYCPTNRTFSVVVTVVSPVTGFEQTHQIDSHCPYDFVLNRTDSIQGVLRTINYHPQAPKGRLFLFNGARLTSTEDAQLEVSQLIVEGSANIELKPDSNITLRPLENWRAPKLRIKADSARGGHLKLLLEGRNGDDGAQPAARSTNPALNGSPGQAAQLRVDCRPRPAGRLSPDTAGETCSKVCVQAPTAGSAGQPGQRRGEDGRPGLPGIGTSEVELYIAQIHDLQVSVELKPGRGGQGSPGGLGEPGGQGGAAGPNTDNACSPAAAGPNGPDAPAGPRGPDGANGACGKLKLPRALQSRTSLKDLQLECSRDPRLIDWY
jgi:hypothetical protein